MTFSLSKITLGAVGAAMLLAAAPSFAVVQTFATYSSTSGNRNFRLVNTGSSSNRTVDANIFTIATPASTTAGATPVQFSFLSTTLAPVSPYVTNISALYTFNGTIAKNSGAGVPLSGGFNQAGLSGTFLFVTTSAITVGGPDFLPHTYVAGSVLLGGSFTAGSFSGTIGNSAGSSTASGTSGSTISFYSDFLDFTSVVDLDRVQSLSGVTQVFAKHAKNNGSLKSFSGVVGGQFSSNPIPIVNYLAPVSNVPEPESWALMVIGFGMLGVASRRRKAVVAA
jgi:hypothetical protein